MKLLIFTYKFPPAGGGSGSYAAGLAKGLAVLGHEVKVLAPVDPGHDAPEEDAARAYDLRRTRLRGGPVGYAVGALHLLWELARFRPQALLLADTAGQNAAALAMLAVPSSLRYSLIVHSDEIARKLGHTGGTWLQRRRCSLLRRLYLRARSVVCVSERTREGLLGAYPQLRSRALVVHNGIDRARFSLARPNRAREVQHMLEGADPVLLTVARLVPTKGIDTVLACLPELAREFPNLRYAIVGSGDDRERLEALAEDLSIADRVVFAGYATDDLLRAWYAACDVFVMVSRREGFPLVYLEAAACGKPVIGARIGGVPEFIRDGENGLLVAPGEIRETTAAIRTLLRSEELRRRMGQAGQELVQQRFTIEIMAKATLDAALQ